MDESKESSLSELSPNSRKNKRVCPNSRKNKMVCLEKEDRISDLDENVLIHVLSFLPTKDAIKTCVLSKRWRGLWTYVPCLSFIIKRTDFVDGFIKLIENTISLNKSPKIFKFHLDMRERCYRSHGSLDPKVLDKWIHFATNKANVEELSVFPYPGFYDTEEVSSPYRNYLLPWHVFTCSSLTKLNLSYCHIVPHGIVTWTLLKSLSIQGTKLSESVIQNILSGSPALEVLEICECSGLNRLEVTCSSLRKLVINHYYGNEKPIYTNNLNGILEIFAPNIQALEILGNFGKKCRLVDVSSLVTARFGFRISRWPLYGSHDENAVMYYRESQNMLKEILNAVRDVKELTLECFCFQIVTTLLEMRNLHSSLPKCKSLTVKGLMMSERELQGLVRLQQQLPSLEILTIDQSTWRISYTITKVIR